MIPLRLATDPLPIDEPLVVRLRNTKGADARSAVGRDATLISFADGVAEYDADGFSVSLRTPDPADIDGDVILFLPGQKSAHRVIRHRSRHNTLLVTEQCDQLCVMCSQPPKKHHHDLFPAFTEALELAPEGATIGITGGEPLLHKHALFEMLRQTRQSRPDLQFHVLTNAQHFGSEDLDALAQLGPTSTLWGIPLYAAEAALHDRIVGKVGAFAQLTKNFALLARAGARIELRTVLLRSNAEKLAELADFISLHLPFIERWAIMQLENIGYGRMNWATEFFDNSVSFRPVADAMNIAAARGLAVQLYNFPLCTIPTPYRGFAVRAISDWKNKYLPICEGCQETQNCGGFFAWHPEKNTFQNIGLR